MKRIERDLSRLAELADNVPQVPQKSLDSIWTHCTGDRLNQTMQEIELYPSAGGNRQPWKKRCGGQWRKCVDDDARD